MASSEDRNFNATACFRGLSKAQLSFGRNLDAISAAAAPPSSQPIRRQDEGLGGESMAVVRKLERRGLLNIDLNVAPPEAADFDLTAAAEGGNEPETPPPAPLADDSAKKEGISDEVAVNFNAEMKTTEIGVDAEEKGRNRRWVALLGVAENALREKKEEEIRNGKRGGEAAARKRIGSGGQRRHSLVEEWNDEVAAAAAVVVRSTRGRAVAMPRKYSDSVLGSAAAAVEAELPRHSKNGKSATVFCTKRKSR